MAALGPIQLEEDPPPAPGEAPGALPAAGLDPPPDRDSLAGIGGRMIGATALSVLGQAIPMGLALVATPIVLRLLGPAQYGVFALVTATLTYFVLAAGMGMGLTSTRFASDALARGDGEEEVAVVWTTLVVTMVPALVIAVVMWFAADPLVHLLHVPAGLRGSAAFCFRLAAFAGMARLAANVFNTPQMARVKWSTYTLVDSGTNVLQVVLTPALLLLWPNVIAAVIVLLGAALVAAIGQLVFSARLQPALLTPRFRRSLLRPIITFGGGLAISALASVPLTNAAQFILAGVVSVKDVAYFAVALSITSLLTVAPLALSAPLLPTITRARYDRARLEHVYALSLRLLSLWIVPVAGLLVFAAHPFIGWWAGARYAGPSSRALYIMLAGVVLGVLDYGPQTLLEAWGRTRTIALVRVIEIGPLIALTIVLVSALGVEGAAIAWTARFVVECVAFTVLAYRVTGLGPGPLVGGGVRQLLAALLLFVPPAAAMELGASDVVVLGLGLVFTAVNLAFSWRFLLSADERVWVTGRLRGLLARASPSRRRARLARAEGSA